MRKVLLSFGLALLWSTRIRAQTVDDGLMTKNHSLYTGLSYGHDQWSDYWEGTLKRDNANIGTLTTQSVSWMGTYGVSDRLNLLADLPFISTSASGGTLQPQHGLQDIGLGAKYRVFEGDYARGNSSLRGFVVASFAAPVSNYVIDLLPLSIGLGSKRVAGRATLSYSMGMGLFADATSAYTWRSNVTLDRSSYFTNGQLFLTNQVEMPNVFDYTVRVGYMNHGWMIPVSYIQQNTLGGGDIRRQDMPFVSDKMNFSRLDAMAMYSIPRTEVALKLEVARVLAGRNVGQSTTLTGGFMYTLRFSGK